jgi:hypothetical protein
VRPSLVALLTVLLGLAVVPYPAAPAAASCAAPWLSFDGERPGRERVEVARGEELTVLGRGFVSGCDDQGEVSAFSCSGNDVGQAEEPMVDIELYVAQQRPTYTQVSLGMADAGTAEDNRLGWVTWTFTVPETMRLGGAQIWTEGSESLRVRVVR